MKLTKPALILMIIGVPVGVVFGAYAGTQAPWLIVLFVLGLVGLVVWVLANNKQGAKMSGAAVEEAKAMRAPDGRARVFVVRRGFMGTAQGLNISTAGYEGQMRGGFLLTADVDPGVVTVSARLNKQGEVTRVSHELTLTPGAVTLVEITLISGMVRLSPVFEEITDRDQIRYRVSPAKPIEWLVRP